MWEMSKFWVFLNFPPSTGSPIKVQGNNGEQSKPEGCNNFLTFGKKGDTWCMILGDNPAGHCFILRN